MPELLPIPSSHPLNFCCSRQYHPHGCSPSNCYQLRHEDTVFKKKLAEMTDADLAKEIAKRPASEIKTELIKVVVGGTQHNEASSFTEGKLLSYTQTKVYRDQRVLWVCPSRGMIPTSVVVSMLSMQWPMNHFRTHLIAVEGLEVAAAYNRLFGFALNETEMIQSFGREYGKAMAAAPFVLTTEEDNIIPSDAVPKLMEAIYTCPDCGAEVGGREWKCEAGHRGFDAVSGLYWLKTDPPMPMAFGLPSDPDGDYRPVDIASAVQKGSLIEVRGIAMGCALWRKAIFRKMDGPWFETSPNFTQDLFLCKKAKREVNARFGVHCGVRVGHLDSATGHFY